MNKTNPLKLTSIALALAFGVSSAYAAPMTTSDEANGGLGTSDQDSATIESAFQKMDVDNDGTLTRSEVAKEKGFKGFSTADTDHDGTLDQKEYAAHKAHVQKAHAKRVVGDSTITTKVKAKILKDEGLKGMQIHVKTYQGTVLLSGFVDNQSQIDHAKEVAEGTEGVKSVKNSLVVKKS